MNPPSIYQKMTLSLPIIKVQSVFVKRDFYNFCDYTDDGRTSDFR